MKLLAPIFICSIALTAVAKAMTPAEGLLAEEPLPSSYSIATGAGELSYNYTPNLGGFSVHGLQLRVWLTTTKAIVSPGEDFSLTIHYENISKNDVWVPDPVEWTLHGYANIESGASSMKRSSFDPHSSPKRLAPKERMSFKIDLEAPIKEPGFIQLRLKWGAFQEISPHPVVVQCRKAERIEQDGGPDA